MLEFKRYIERRDRTEAFQLLSLSDVEMVATIMHADAFTVTADFASFEVELTYQDADPVTIKRGDFIDRDCWAGRSRVVPCGIFREAWEEEK